MDGQKKVSTVYLIHSLPLEMSAIQVFTGDKMAVVAHLVSADTIGHEPDLGLNSDFTHLPWRAMIIKDNAGDWGICAAAWKGMTSGKPGTPGRPGRRGVKGTPGNPGYFKMFFKNLRTGITENITMPRGSITRFLYHTRQYRFSINDEQMHVDLDKGHIVISPKTTDVLQNVTLAFATSMLYLMVQPRPKDVETATEVFKASKNSVKPLYLDSGDMAFLLFCGWSIRNHVPTNSTLRHHCGLGQVAGCISGIGVSAETAFGASGMTDFDVGDCGGCGGCGGCGACGSGGMYNEK